MNQLLYILLLATLLLPPQQWSAADVCQSTGVEQKRTSVNLSHCCQTCLASCHQGSCGCCQQVQTQGERHSPDKSTVHTVDGSVLSTEICCCLKPLPPTPLPEQPASQNGYSAECSFPKSFYPVDGNSHCKHSVNSSSRRSLRAHCKGCSLSIQSHMRCSVLYCSWVI